MNRTDDPGFRWYGDRYRQFRSEREALEVIHTGMTVVTGKTVSHEISSILNMAGIPLSTVEEHRFVVLRTMGNILDLGSLRIDGQMVTVHVRKLIFPGNCFYALAYPEDREAAALAYFRQARKSDGSA